MNFGSKKINKPITIEATIIGKSNTQIFISHLQNIPQLRESLDWLKEDETRFGKIAIMYIALVDKIAGYGSNEANIIEKARNKMEQDGVDTTSASTISSAKIIRRLDPDKANLLRNTVRQAFDPNSSQYISTLDRVEKKMLKASQRVRIRSEKPKDGVPFWDEVIWSHTQLHKDAEPKTVAHVYVAHYLAQFMLKEFPEDFAEKDDFLELLTDAILLEETRRPNSTGLLKVWITHKSEKGLGWIEQEQLVKYHEVTNEIPLIS